eukprot:jgi/Hompol1/6166/HPOL_002177-RA
MSDHNNTIDEVSISTDPLSYSAMKAGDDTFVDMDHRESSDTESSATAAYFQAIHGRSSSVPVLERHITRLTASSTAQSPIGGSTIQLGRIDTYPEDVREHTHGRLKNMIPREIGLGSSYGGLNGIGSARTSVAPIGRLDIFDTLDPDAPEVVAVKSSISSTAISFWEILALTPFFEDVKSRPMNYAEVRHAYRLQRQEKRQDPVTPRNYLLKFILITLNIETFRRMMIKILKSKRRVVLFMFLDLLLNVISCLMYLAEIQYHVSTGGQDVKGWQPSWFWTSRPSVIFYAVGLLCAANLLSMVIRLSFSENLRQSIFSTDSLMDVIITIPFLVITRFEYGRFIYVPYFLRSLVLIPQLKNVLRLRSFWPPINFNSYKEKLIILITTVLILIFNAICLFQYFETKFAGEKISTGKDLTLMQTFYYIVIT